MPNTPENHRSQQPGLSGRATALQPWPRFMPVALGLAAIVLLALWLPEPARAWPVVLAATVPAWLILACGRGRVLAAAAPIAWRWRGHPGHWLDSRTGLLAEQALAELGGPLLARSQRRGQPLALLVFDFEDLGEVQDLYGVRARRKLLGLIGRGLRHLAGRKGLALRVTPTRFVVVLPGCTRALALARAAARLGRSCSFELDSAQHDLVLVPRVSALCATAETDSIQALLRQVQAKPVARPAGPRPQVTAGASSSPLRLPQT